MARPALVASVVVLSGSLLAVDLGAQTVGPGPRLHRNCTPAVWQAEDVRWSGDESPHNKIDDLIDAAVTGPFDIIVNFRRCVRPSDLGALTRLAPGGQVQFRNPYIPSVFMAQVSRAGVTAIAGLPQVAFIERQGLIEATLDVSASAVQVATGFYSPQTVRDLDPSLDGAGTAIAILDSGVDDPGGPGSTHATFDDATRFFDGLEENEANPDDVAGHGTLVASIALGRGFSSILAFPSGIAPGANLIDVKVLKDDASGTEMPIHQSLAYLLAQREGGAWQVDIINMSLKKDSGSSDGKDSLSQLVDLASARGIVVVTTTANDGVRGFPAPGAATRSITVAASDDRSTTDREDDKLGTDSADKLFSNFGPRKSDGDQDHLDELKPEVTAPGDEVLGALVNTGIGQVPFSSSHCIPARKSSCFGTSFAAPHVAGLASLIIQNSLKLGRSRINPASVKQLITSTADSDKRRGTPSSIHDTLWNDRWGWGLINGYEAIRVMSDPARMIDLTFPNHGAEPSWLSPDVTTVPEKLRPGTPATVKVRIKNPSSSLTARDVWIVLGVYDYSASVPAFTAIGTLKMDIPPGEHEISFPWTPEARKHQCLEVEIGYGPDTSFLNNTAQRNLEFAESPVVFQVQNTVSESPREIRFETVLDPPTNDWTVTITPPTVVLAGDDCPADVQVLLEPKPGVPPGARQRVHVAAMIGGTLLGGVTVEASVPAFPDCNENDVDDAVDVAGGGSRDLDGSGVPDECESGRVDWRFRGTAQGGAVTLTVTGFSAVCPVMVTTLAGQSAAVVAANLAAAVNGDACMAGQGITAQAAGGILSLSGLGLTPDRVTETSTDAGLEHAESIPTVQTWGLLSLALALAALGARQLARRRTA